MHRSPTRRAARVLLAAAALAIASACGSDAGEPRPSLTYAVELDSPNGDEGAAVFELEGDVAAVRAPAGSRVMTNDVGSVTRVIVVRDEPGAIAFEIDLAERGVAPDVSVVEVSGPDDALRPSTGSYSVSVRGTR